MGVTGSIPATMKAVFLNKTGEVLIAKEVKTPVPQPGEVLVKIAAAPINPSDISMVRNAYKESDLNTFIPGLEGSGRVVAAGKGMLPGLWLGKRVACSAGSDSGGTWAEYMVTSATKCFPLNSKISDEQGSMSLVNPLTALAFFDIAKKNNHKAIINNAAASALGRMVEMLGDKKKFLLLTLFVNLNRLNC
jgi:NADPH:quinone reductase